MARKIGFRHGRAVRDIAAARRSVTGHGKLFEQKLVERAVERLHRRVNQADDDFAGIARRIELQVHRWQGRGRERLRRRRRIKIIIVIHVGHVAVVLKLIQRGIRGGGIGKLQAVNAEFVQAADDFRAEHFGESVGIHARLEFHEQFIGHMFGLAGPGHAHQLRGVFHLGGENIEMRRGIGLRHQGEIEIAEQPSQRLSGRKILEFGGGAMRRARLDIDPPAGLSGDFFQQVRQAQRMHVRVHAVGGLVPDNRVGLRREGAETERGEQQIKSQTAHNLNDGLKPGSVNNPLKIQFPSGAGVTWLNFIKNAISPEPPHVGSYNHQS